MVTQKIGGDFLEHCMLLVFVMVILYKTVFLIILLLLAPCLKKRKNLKMYSFPAGGENTDLQLEVMKDIGTTAYVGVPDFLKIILKKLTKKYITFKINKSNGNRRTSFPAVAQNFRERNIHVRQCYGTADLGLVAYEAAENDGMVIDENVILEIVKPALETLK